MKYVLLVSHGTMAQGVQSVLAMLAGGAREDVLATSLQNGMGADEFAEKVKECIQNITPEDEILLFADLVGGSPLTTAANVIAEKGLIGRTTMIGGMNFPLVLSAVLQKDFMDTADLMAAVIPEARDALQEFQVRADDSEDDI